MYKRTEKLTTNNLFEFERNTTTKNTLTIMFCHKPLEQYLHPRYGLKTGQFPNLKIYKRLKLFQHFTNNSIVFLSMFLIESQLSYCIMFSWQNFRSNSSPDLNCYLIQYNRETRGINQRSKIKEKPSILVSDRKENNLSFLVIYTDILI